MVLILKDPFHRRKFVLLTALQMVFILYIIRKNILMIHISTERNHFPVFVQRGFFYCDDVWFSFCKAYLTEKILLILTSPEGFDPVYKSQ